MNAAGGHTYGWVAISYSKLKPPDFTHPPKYYGRIAIRFSDRTWPFQLW